MVDEGMWQVEDVSSQISGHLGMHAVVVVDRYVEREAWSGELLIEKLRWK